MRQFVKRCRCTVCGAPKKLTSVTAYVYCDYCGSLADFDLHRACEGSTLPGPEYRSLVNGVQPQLKAARAAGDAVLPGAKVVVYDECGRSLDVGSAALTCPGCGGSVTLAVGEANTPCPFCQSNVARIGVL
jgi:Zn finger protein HypA/HybF involved in hydrogenase expression